MRLKLIDLFSQPLLELSSLFGKPPLIFVELKVKVFERLTTNVCGFHDFVIGSKAFKLKQAHSILEAIINLMMNHTHFFTFDLVYILGE